MALPVTIAHAKAASGAGQAHRVIFIDLARALAVVMMVYGHTTSALLGASYREGPWFDVWQFQRGLTSSLFLLLSGFAFSIATSRHWPSHVVVSRAFVRRIQRFGLFVLLGYALHFPVRHAANLLTVSDARWRSFVAVDVLQLVGVTLIALQVLVLVSQSRRVFMAAAFALAVAIVVETPFMWSTDWSGSMPLALAGYLSPSVGSQFPLFPWAAYVLLGAAIGKVYARWGAARLPAFTNWVLLVPGVVLTLLGVSARGLLVQPFGGGTWNWVPADVVTRVGVSLMILSIIAHASRRISHLPHVFGAVAQESLLIYFVHLCIVYGSIWNRGLAQEYGEALSPLETGVVVIALITAMAALAWQWNHLKHARPRMARWVSVGAAAMLVLLVI